MEYLLLPLLLAAGAWHFTNREQQRRIALLGTALGKYRIEQLMQHLTEGYLRWLDEQDPARRKQVWGMLQGMEQTLAGQFRSFAADFARIDAPQAQVSKLPFAIPFAQPLLPGHRLFDARRVFAVHAAGIEASASNALDLPPKAKAYMMTAELYLMQHTCHWFCRSKGVASARLLARHQTSYAQVHDAVAPQTRAAYDALVS